MDVTVVSADDAPAAPAYDAELIFLRHALGVRSFGMQRLPAHYRSYAEHDEAESRQEEVYAVVLGSARLIVAGDEHRLVPGVFGRAGATTPRRIETDDESALLLCLGGVPGEVYQPPAWTDPAAR